MGRSRANNVFLGSENGLGGGSELWRGLGAAGGSGASGCGLEYRGQPNAVSGVGASAATSTSRSPTRPFDGAARAFAARRP